MLTYGGVPLAVVTPEIAVRIEKALAPRDTYGFERFDWPGITRLAWASPSMPAAPPVRVGVLYWPRDAMRWSVFYGLATTNELNKIRAQLASAYAALPLVISQENESRTTVQSITTSLWMLPPKPVWQITGRNGLYLLTLVDDRYWWQLRDTGDITVTPGTTTWANLYASLASALGITITADAINSAYLTPSTALTARYDNSAMMLDCVARNVGQRIVRKLDGTVYALNVTSSQATMTANLATLGTSLVQPISGGKLAFTPGLPNDLPAVLPGTVRVTFPKISGGNPTGDVYPVTTTLAALNLSDLGTTGNANTKTFHDSCSADGTGTPANLTELQTLVTQQATDWYRYQVAPYDGKLAGIVPWTLEGLSDSVEWVYRQKDVSTRIHRPPWNDLDEQLLHGSASATPASVPPSEDSDAVFIAAGPSHAPGDVPDPGSTAHTPPYYLGDDAAWHTITSALFPLIANTTWDLGIYNLTWIATGSGAVGTAGMGKQYEDQGIEIFNAPIEICGVQFWCCYTVGVWDDATYPAGHVDNWSVTNPATVYRISTSASGGDMQLSGIAPFNTTIGGVTTLYPQVIALTNVSSGSKTITLTHQDANSAADNRFLLPAAMSELKLKVRDSVILWYDTCRKAATGTGAWIVLARGQAQVTTLNSLEGDINLVGGTNVTITPNGANDPRTITISVTDVDTYPTATNGQSFLGADASLTSTYANTALSVTLPVAGTYLIVCDIASKMQVALTGSQDGEIWARLFNNTDTAAIANSDRQTLYVASQENGEIQEASSPLSMIVTTSGANKQIVLQGKYITAGTVTTAAFSSGNGTAMSYVQLA